MFSLRRVNATTVGFRCGYILPKQSLPPLMSAKFETFSKQQRTQETRFNVEKRTDVLPKYCQNFYLPMGTKKSVFLQNRSIERKSKPLLIPNHHQKMDLVLSLSSQDSIESTLPRRSKEKKPPKPKANLELVSYQLTHDLTNIFMKRQEWRMYHKEMVFVDNVRGVRVDGLEKYMLLINIMRMLAHVRFVYVRMTLLSVSKDEETSTIKIRWNIVGLGMVRLVLRYFPDRLWEKGNMERMAPAYLDGYSTFYVNSDNKIYQHSLDSVRSEQGKNINKSVLQRLLELVGKQARVAQPV